jgi:hypothetical protein
MQDFDPFDPAKLNITGASLLAIANLTEVRPRHASTMSASLRRRAEWRVMSSRRAVAGERAGCGQRLDAPRIQRGRAGGPPPVSFKEPFQTPVEFQGRVEIPFGF